MICWLFWLKWLSQNFYSMHVGKTRRVGEVVAALWSLMTLKWSSRNSDYQSNLKYIRPPFPWKPYMSPGYDLQPLPWELWGRRCLYQRHNFRTLHLQWIKLLSQNFGWVSLGKWWMGGGGCSQIDVDSCYNFQSQIKWKPFEVYRTTHSTILSQF